MSASYGRLISNKKNIPRLGDPNKFYKHAEVKFKGIEEDSNLGKRLSRLIDKVVQKLPDEEQFCIVHAIWLHTKESFIESAEEYLRKNPHASSVKQTVYELKTSMMLWQQNIDPVCKALKEIGSGPDGFCFFLPAFKKTGDMGDSNCAISLIADHYEYRIDYHIMGVIAHELAEMSYKWRMLKKDIPNMIKMKDKGRNARFRQLTQSGLPGGSDEYYKHEELPNNEARRLGFGKEIDEMLKCECVEPKNDDLNG